MLTCSELHGTFFSFHVHSSSAQWFAVTFRSWRAAPPPLCGTLQPCRDEAGSPRGALHSCCFRLWPARLPGSLSPSGPDALRTALNSFFFILVGLTCTIVYVISALFLPVSFCKAHEELLLFFSDRQHHEFVCESKTQDWRPHQRTNEWRTNLVYTNQSSI